MMEFFKIKNGYFLRVLFLLMVMMLMPLLCLQAQNSRSNRWDLSVNNDKAPLEMMMTMGQDVESVVYLFDITRDTLNLSFVHEEDRDWRKRRLSVFAMPKNKEVLRLRILEDDLTEAKVVFGRMWKAMPREFKNVLTLFELREYGVSETREKIEYPLIRFKMKPPRRRRSVEL